MERVEPSGIDPTGCQRCGGPAAFVVNVHRTGAEVVVSACLRTLCGWHAVRAKLADVERGIVRKDDEHWRPLSRGPFGSAVPSEHERASS